jgi:sugar phosphate isomerase/epimerase
MVDRLQLGTGAGFRTAVVLPMLYPEAADGGEGLLNAAATLAREGFIDAVEVPRPGDAGVAARLGALLATSHVAAIYAAAGTLLGGRHDLAAPGERGLQVHALVREMVKEAYDLGARLMVLNSGPDPGQNDRRSAVGRLVAALRAVCRFSRQEAEGRGVLPLGLALEAFDRDVDKMLLVGPTAEAALIADEVRADYPEFGLALDLAHLVLLGEDPAQSVAAAGRRAIHVHLGNCCLARGLPAWGDKHPPFGCPGGRVGVAEVASFIGALEAAGYFAPGPDGRPPYLGFEVKPLPGDDPRGVLAGCQRVLREALAMARRAG